MQSSLSHVEYNICSATSAVKPDEIAFFHADLEASQRSDRMREFRSKAIVATIATTAFGTGVNFQNIRLIMHYTIPATLVEYLQTLGVEVAMGHGTTAS